VELFYFGANAITIENEQDTEHIYVHCDNPFYYASLLRYLTNAYRNTGAEIHLPPEISSVAETTGFDRLLGQSGVATV